MWELICNTGQPEQQWREKKDQLSDRLTALVTEKAKAIPQAADHGPNTWSPQPDGEGNLTLAAAVGQALGTTSVCWLGGDPPTEFDSTWIDARRVYDGLMAFLADWADGIRREANQATAAKLVAKERWL
jgi:hypothetical protein